MELIGATKIPQQPKNHLQAVICDADLFHLSLPEYCRLQELLRYEWSEILDKQYEENDWHKLNMDFLINHHYFTAYGKNVLTPRKEVNIKLCKNHFNKNKKKKSVTKFIPKH